MFQSTKAGIAHFILLLVTLVGGYLYLTQIDLTLLNFIHDPFFSSTALFFKKHLLLPGGISEYVNLFVFQYYQYRGVGITIIICLTLVWWFLLHVFFSKILHSSSYVLIIILLTLPLWMEQGNYMSMPRYLVICLLALSNFNLYLKLKNYKSTNCIIFFIFASITFYLTGIFGLVFFFAANFISELKGQRYLYLFYQMAIAILPVLVWLSFKSYYGPVAEVFKSGFFIDKPLPGQWLINFLPVLFIGFSFLAMIFEARIKLISGNFWFIAGQLVFVVSIQYYLCFYVGYQPLTKNLLKVERYASEKKWDEVINCATRELLENKFAASHVYRALYHKGILLDQLFQYPAVLNQETLIVQNPVDVSNASALKDIYFEMGMVNESRHWANEAITATGYHPRFVKRLIECYLILGSYAAAEKYINVMASSPVQHRWAKHYQTYLHCESCIANDRELGPVKRAIAPSDFIVTYNDPYKNLLNLVKDSTVSKMAFEYYVAYELLRRNPIAVLEQIKRFKQLGYIRLPLACQQAILLYKATKRIKNSDDLMGYHFDEKVLADFNRFSDIIFNQYKGNFEQARNSLSDFRQTFWYYFIYKKNENSITQQHGLYQE